MSSHEPPSSPPPPPPPPPGVPPQQPQYRTPGYPPPREGRAMAPLLDEDEDAMVVDHEDIDLGVAGVDEAVGNFIDADEAEEDSVDEEDEEP